MRLFVKICGITDLLAAVAAAEAGADALGFVFHPPSRRYLDPGRAGEIARFLDACLRERAGGGAGAATLGGAGPVGVPARVGVFVDAGLEEIRRAAWQAALDFLQLHGSETPAFCREARRTTGCRIIKALRVGPDGRVAAEGWRLGDADFFLLDTAVPGWPGGTGRCFDWRVARGLRLPAPVLVAGGLTPDNVADALEAARPAGVDVSSGVETDGRKDADKVRAFVARVRRWERERADAGTGAGADVSLAR